ncbi:MAG: ATP-binding cassette domain-containing protein [Bacilli bacterium]
MNDYLCLALKSKSVKGKILLKDVNISFPSHGLFLIKGPNGAGKTTLLSILSGLDSSFDGELIFLGNKIDVKNKNSYFDEHVSFVPQNNLVFDDVSVVDNVFLSNNIKDRKKAIDVLKDFGLENNINQGVSSLSDGEKQRLCLARAFYNLKDIVLLDEVTAFLDKDTREIIWKQIAKISKDHLVLFVTQEVIDKKTDDINGLLEIQNQNCNFVLYKSGPKMMETRALAPKIKSNHTFINNIKMFNPYYIVILLFAFLFSFASILFGNLYFSLPEERLSEITYQNYINTANAYYISPKQKSKFTQTQFGLSMTSFSIKDENNDNYSIGNQVFGIFTSDSYGNSNIRMIKGKYPKSSDELIISSFCYDALDRGGEFSEFSIDNGITQYRIVGVYEGKNSENYQKMMTLFDDEKYSTPSNINLRYCYTFLVESGFSYGTIEENEGAFVLASDNIISELDYKAIKDTFLSYPYVSVANLSNDGTLPLDSNLFYADKSYLIFGLSFLSSILALFIIITLSFFFRNNRQFILFRITGVPRRRLTLDVFVSFALVSFISVFLGMLGAISATFILQSHYQSLMNLKTISLFTNHYLFFILTLLVVMVGLLVFALMLFNFISPKNNQKQLEEIKKK